MKDPLVLVLNEVFLRSKMHRCMESQEICTLQQQQQSLSPEIWGRHLRYIKNIIVSKLYNPSEVATLKLSLLALVLT